MKHLVWFLLRHDLLPNSPRLRRRMLRSIFKPPSIRDVGTNGWYDLGADPTPEQVERFKVWESRDE